MIEPFVISRESSDVTAADCTAQSFQDLWSYRVPKGTKIHLRPEDVLAILLKQTDNTAIINSDRVKVEVRDATGTEKIPVLQETQYANFGGEFQDEDKLVHLDILKPMVVGEQEYIVVLCYSVTPFADADTYSYFELRTHREV